MRRLISILVLTTAFACGDREIGWERDRTIIGPIPLKDRVAYIDNARDRVIVVDMTGSRPEIHGYTIGRRAIFAVPTPDKEHLAVVTRGEEAIVKGQIDEAPTLWLVDVSEPNTVPVSYPVGSPFDRIAIAEDGSLAVVYFSDAGPDSEGVFRNPNELAVVDLSREADDTNPTLKTVRSFGSAPSGVVLSPPITVPDAPDSTPRTFAFVLAFDSVTVIDATYPERNEVSIRLDGTGDQVLPRELVFDPTSATAYLRSDNARDVLEILIRYEEPSPNDAFDNDYRTALAELGAGGGPADIAVYDDPEGRRFVLAATPGTREVVVIDTETGEFTAVPTPDPIDRILLFPADPDVAPRVALLASISAGRSQVHLLSLDGIRDELVAIDLETVELSQPVLDVVPVPGRDLAMIVHDDNRTVLGLLDVGIGSVSPLQGVGRLDSYDFSADGRYLMGATLGVERVGFLQLDNLHPLDMRLDDTPVGVLSMGGGSVFVDHGDPFGRATIMPSPESRREDAVVISGFLLADVLNEEL